MSKILLAVNTLTAVSSQAYSSHLNLAFRMGKDNPEDDFILFNGYRTGIDRFRNMAGKVALQNECDFLMFLDDDVLVPRDTYKLMKARMDAIPELDIITPVVFIRSYPFKPMFFKAIVQNGQTGLTHYDDWKEQKTFEGLLHVAAIGFSCALIRTDLLMKVPPAWFVTGTDHTEDVYFCIKAKQTMALKNESVGICIDTQINAGHILDPEFVSDPTRESLLKFYEDMNPSLQRIPNGDHDQNYVSKNKEALSIAPEVTL